MIETVKSDVCSLIQSTQKEKQGMCFQIFILQPNHSYFSTGSRETNRIYHCHIFNSHTEGKLRAPRFLDHLLFLSISITALGCEAESELLTYTFLSFDKHFQMRKARLLADSTVWFQGPKSIIFTNFRKLTNLTQNINLI